MRGFDNDDNDYILLLRSARQEVSNAIETLLQVDGCDGEVEQLEAVEAMLIQQLIALKEIG
jgi:hypothetical protein